LFKVSSNLMNFEEGNINKEEVRDIWDITDNWYIFNEYKN
jgi:hypothetical protein